MKAKLEVSTPLIATLAPLANGRTPPKSILLMCHFSQFAPIAKPDITEPSQVRPAKILLASNVSKASTTMVITAVTCAPPAPMDLLPGSSLPVSARNALLADGAQAPDLPPMISAVHVKPVHSTLTLAPLCKPIAYLAVLANTPHLLELRHALIVTLAPMRPQLV